MAGAAGWYDRHAMSLETRYEGLSPEAVHEWFVDPLPAIPATILDVGAGTGRDAALLAAQG